jgi:hypothetical protein
MGRFSFYCRHSLVRLSDEGMDELESLLFSRRGAVKAVSEEANISAAAVSQWKRNGIPLRRRELVARVLGVEVPPPVLAAASPIEAEG